MNKCLFAYNKKGERIETFEEHVINGVNLINKTYLKMGYAYLIMRRINAVSHGQEKLDFEQIKWATITSYILHDVGKLFVPLQDRIREGSGAYGHELLSAIYTYDVLEGESSWLSKAISAAILSHHHALRRISDVAKQFYNEIQKHGFNSISLPNVHANSLRDLVFKISQDLPAISNLAYKIVEKSYIPDELPHKVSQITLPLSKKITLEHNLVRTAFHLLAHPILTADNFAASLAAKKTSPESYRPKPWLNEYLMVSNSLRLDDYAYLLS